MDPPIDNETQRPRDGAAQIATESADLQTAGTVAGSAHAGPPRWPRRLVGGLLLAAVAVALVRAQKADELPPREPVENSARSDEVLHTLLCGTWRREKDGMNVLTLHEDGTGTLVYEPESWQKKLALATSRLEIEIEWSVENGYVDFHSVRGEPSYAFTVASTYEGKRKYRRIAELDEQHLVLVNETQKDDGPKSEWFRVE